MDLNQPHIPILVKEWLKVLEGRPLKYYVDGTLGAAGHAKAVLQAHEEIELFIGIDQDPSALKIAKERLKPWKEKVKLVSSNFTHIEEILLSLKIGEIDGMLLDLGVSSMQLDDGKRGFSFNKEGPLDMRMNREMPLSAANIANTWSENDLGRIFRDYGEEKQWKRAAKAIVQKRKIRPFETTKDLVETLGPVLKSSKKGIHPATQIFQALRIAVNSELEVLRAVLPRVIRSLRKGGVFGVITFHSLEDRIVKNFFRDEALSIQNTSGLAGLFLEKEPTVTVLTKKPIKPSKEEIGENPRSRSAKLRVVSRR